MRAIGTTLWVSAVLFELGACGPRVSVGDLGGGGSANGGAGAGSMLAAGSSQGGTKLAGEGGGKATGGVVNAMAGKGVGGSEPSVGGGATAEGGADSSAAGAPATGCPESLSQFLPPVSVECPDDVPSSGDPCDVAENGICVWQSGIVGQGNVGYEVRGCYSAIDGKRWYGVNQGNLGPVGSDPQHCPKALPDAGTSCSGHAGEYCYFPQAACSCASDAVNWACTENAKPDLVPAPVERLCPPAGVDESKSIKDLSFEEIDAWCRWYAGGGPRPQMSGTDSPGYADSYSTAFIDIGAPVCLMDLPLDWCDKNILLHQECTATLEQLDDCVESIRGTGRANPGPAWVGHGCGPLLSNSSCERLIVQVLPEGAAPSDCKVPVAQDAP